MKGNRPTLVNGALPFMSHCHATRVMGGQSSLPVFFFVRRFFTLGGKTHSTFLKLCEPFSKTGATIVTSHVCLVLPHRPHGSQPDSMHSLPFEARREIR